MFNWLITFSLCILPIILAKPSSECLNQNISEDDLYKAIFGNLTLSKLRPRPKMSETVNVYFQLNLYGIKEFQEREGILITEVYLFVAWEIHHLAWDQIFPYNCTDRILIDSDAIWTPDYTWLSGGFDYHADGRKTLIFNNGEVYQFPMGELHTSCNSDLTYFPFDHQHCDFVLESWHYPAEMQHFKLSGNENDPSLPSIPFDIISHRWHENKLWQIIGNSSKIEAVQYNFNGSHYHRVIYTLHLRRKPLYYVFNIVIPSLIISIVEMAVFVLPMDEQAAKVETSFTCLVAYSVFQSMILSEIPISSHETPLLSIFIVLQMCYIGIIAILGEALVVYLVSKHNKASQKGSSLPPRFALQLALGIRSLLWISKPVLKPKEAILNECSSETINSNQIAGSKVNDKACSQLQETMVKTQLKKFNLDLIQDPWLFLAIVLERFSFVTYLFAVTMTPLLMFICTRDGQSNNLNNNILVKM